jgi:hypothetical protein
MVTKLLHDISQKGYLVYFEGDFEGMLTVTFLDESKADLDRYIRHEHIGYPGSTFEELDAALQKCLSFFFNEVKDGEKPQRDGLAT